MSYCWFHLQWKANYGCHALFQEQFPDSCRLQQPANRKERYDVGQIGLTFRESVGCVTLVFDDFGGTSVRRTEVNWPACPRRRHRPATFAHVALRSRFRRNVPPTKNAHTWRNVGRCVANPGVRTVQAAGVASAVFASAVVFLAFLADFAAGVFPSFNANCPRSTFSNRDSAPFYLISLMIAAKSVACGVCPPGLDQ
jgi:hypothetical protein